MIISTTEFASKVEEYVKEGVATLEEGMTIFMGINAVGEEDKLETTAMRNLRMWQYGTEGEVLTELDNLNIKDIDTEKTMLPLSIFFPGEKVDFNAQANYYAYLDDNLEWKEEPYKG